MTTDYLCICVFIDARLEIWDICRIMAHAIQDRSIARILNE